MSDLFLKLLNNALCAGWLVLALLVLRPMLKRAPKWLMPCLWGLVGLRLISPITIECVFSLIPAANPIPQDIAMAQVPAIDSGIAMIDHVVNPVIGTVFAPEPAASVNPLQILVAVAARLWLAGVIVTAAWAVFSWLRLRRILKGAVNVGGNVWRGDRVDAPFVLGLIKPRIYLPMVMDARQTECILAHERAHIARRDHLWKPLGFALLSVFWFHPLMWVAYILLCRDIELACDERVIRSRNRQERADYMEALLMFSTRQRSLTACPLAFGEVGVKQRIQNVLNYRKPGFWLVVLAVALIPVAVVCFLTNPPSRDTPQETAAQTDPALRSDVFPAVDPIPMVPGEIYNLIRAELFDPASNNSIVITDASSRDALEALAGILSSAEKLGSTVVDDCSLRLKLLRSDGTVFNAAVGENDGRILLTGGPYYRCSEDIPGIFAQSGTPQKNPVKHLPFWLLRENDRVYYTGNGERTDVTDLICRDTPFTAMFMVHNEKGYHNYYIAIGGTVENLGYHEMVYETTREKAEAGDFTVDIDAMESGWTVYPWNEDNGTGSWLLAARDIFDDYGVYWAMESYPNERIRSKEPDSISD